MSPSADGRMWHVRRVQDRPAVRRLPTDRLTPEELAQIRDLLWAAFPPGEEEFSENDWQHAVGGQHFIAEVDGAIGSHASVVERELHVGGHPVRTGYVEAVATSPKLQGRGLGSAVMEAVNAHIVADYELGALGTGAHAFYERLGWQTWRGPTFVRTDGGQRRTPDEDGDILVLPTPTSPTPLDLDAPLSCDWRPGDVW
jgi:aminoglycoside 2'-N-acetyltransferase I